MPYLWCFSIFIAILSIYKTCMCYEGCPKSKVQMAITKELLKSQKCTLCQNVCHLMFISAHSRLCNWGTCPIGAQAQRCPAWRNRRQAVLIISEFPEQLHRVMKSVCLKDDSSSSKEMIVWECQTFSMRWMLKNLPPIPVKPLPFHFCCVCVWRNVVVKHDRPFAQRPRSLRRTTYISLSIVWQ